MIWMRLKLNGNREDNEKLDLYFFIMQHWPEKKKKVVGFTKEVGGRQQQRSRHGAQEWLSYAYNQLTYQQSAKES